MFFSKYESRFQDFMIPNLVSGAYDYVNNITSDSFIDKISKNWIYATHMFGRFRHQMHFKPPSKA